MRNTASYLDISAGETSGRIKVGKSPAMKISDEWMSKIAAAKQELEKTYVLPETSPNNPNRVGKV